MTEKLKRLSKEITDDIREILEGIESGKLRHIQTEFHCGTAHCVAGWKVVKDGVALQNKMSFYEAAETGNVKFTGKNFPKLRKQNPELFYTVCNSVYYARAAWKLTRKESDEFFSPSATLEECFALLKKLESGERLDYN